MTPFMAIATMSVEFVIPIESLSTKSTLRMSLETTLVYSTWNVVAMLLMPTQLRHGKELMFMGKNFLVSGT